MSKRTATERLQYAGIAPRNLDVEAAAIYCGLGRGAFLAHVEAGTFPRPLPLPACTRQIWDIRALDAAIDRLSGFTDTGITGIASPNHDPIMAAIRGTA